MGEHHDHSWRWIIQLFNKFFMTKINQREVFVRQREDFSVFNKDITNKSNQINKVARERVVFRVCLREIIQASQRSKINVNSLRAQYSWLQGFCPLYEKHQREILSFVYIIWEQHQYEPEGGNETHQTQLTKCLLTVRLRIL